jgi:hypothetical protein
MPWFRFRLRRTRRPWMYVEQHSAMLAKRQASAILGRIAFDIERCDEPPRLKPHVAKFAIKYYSERSL